MAPRIRRTCNGGIAHGFARSRDWLAARMRSLSVPERPLRATWRAARAHRSIGAGAKSISPNICTPLTLRPITAGGNGPRPPVATPRRISVSSIQSRNRRNSIPMGNSFAAIYPSWEAYPAPLSTHHGWRPLWILPQQALRLESNIPSQLWRTRPRGPRR